MLKLEKISRTKDLNITIRDRPFLLNKTFLLALSYAVLIHLGAIGIFHVAPFKIGYDEMVYPPVAVATEMPITLNNVTVHLEDENPVPSYLIPSRTIPEIPIVMDQKLFKQMEYIKHRSVLNNPFLSLENHLRVQDVATLFAGPMHYAPVTIHISGNLADQPLVYQNTHEDDLVKLASKNKNSDKKIPYRFVFHVQVEQKSGEIFWWEAKGIEEDKELNKLAINILKSIRFAPGKNEFITVGDIEIVLIP